MIKVLKIFTLYMPLSPSILPTAHNRQQSSSVHLEEGAVVPYVLYVVTQGRYC